MILPLLMILIVFSQTAPLAHADSSTKPTSPGSTCISNGLLSAEVRNVTDGSQMGKFTFAKGGCPILQDTANPNLILFPIRTSFNTVRVWDTNTDYAPGSFATNAPFTEVNLDTQSPVLQTETPTQATIGWSTSANSLNIAQDLEVQGSSTSDSRIRMTLSVHNGDTVAHTVSLRNLLDLFIGDYDGAWIRLFDGTTPGPITGIEEDFAPPYNFTAFQMSGCSSNPCTPGNFGSGTFSLYGSVSLPPEATTPSRFVYGWWRPMFAWDFNYTSVPRQIGSTTPNIDDAMDSALLYFFGPVALQPGQSTSESIFLSNQPAPILAPPASGLTVSKFFTRGQAVGNFLPLDSNGNPMVNVVLAGGIVRSINPGEIRAWVNVTNTVTNTASIPLESLRLTETLPVDWLVHPQYLPGRGAIHVLFADPDNGSPNREITHSVSLSVSTGNPETVTLTIPNFDTVLGHALMPGQSILLSVKLDYGLVGTSQSAGSYPRDYTDTATADGFAQQSYIGTEVSGTANGLFVAYAKVVGGNRDNS